MPQLPQLAKEVEVDAKEAIENTRPNRIKRMDLFMNPNIDRIWMNANKGGLGPCTREGRGGVCPTPSIKLGGWIVQR